MINVIRSSIFIKWLDRLKDWTGKALIDMRVKRLEQGLYGDIKPIEDDIFEMRIRYGPGYRVYCMESGKEIVILLCGGLKKTQDADIDRAKKIAGRYKAGKEG